MTAEEKAKELIEKFRDVGDDFPVLCSTWCEGGTPDYNGLAKQCALICVEEIILSDDNEHPSEIKEEFWQEVKKHLEN